MAPDHHSTASNPPCTASLASSVIATPTPYVSYWLRLAPISPVVALAEFAAEHRHNAESLLAYQANGRKRSLRLSRAVLNEYDPAASIGLLANNPESRIDFAKAMVHHLQTFADSADPLVHWVTLIPDQFSVDESEAAEFQIKRLQAWTHQVMRGSNYVGIAEAALFGNIGKIVMSWHRAVSWHVHLIVWGITTAETERLIKAINKRCKALIPGVDPAYSAIIPARQVTEKVLYMAKAPRSEHRVYAKRKTVTDRSTGEITTPTTGRFKAKKQPLRPIDMARMANVMSGKFLPQLAFAGGEGKPILDAVRTEALKPLRLYEARVKAKRHLQANSPVSQRFAQRIAVRPKPPQARKTSAQIRRG